MSDLVHSVSGSVPVERVEATVFKALNGRRYFTLRGACRASARKTVLGCYRSRGLAVQGDEEFGHDVSWDHASARIERLSRLYLRAARAA